MPRWIPLESNPEVFNSWSQKAGLISSRDKFEDVYGLDPELLKFVTQPVKAVVLLFPLTPSLETKRKEEEAAIGKDGQPLIDSTIIWIKQTISNACGTIGLLHALANSNVNIRPESPLSKFIDQCMDKTPEERAKILETTPLFADIHSAAASAGQTAVPENLDTDLHFTCFVQAPEGNTRETFPEHQKMRLIELDGRRGGPVDRGECKDLLQDVARVVKDYYIGQSTSMSFSMLSLSGQDLAKRHGEPAVTNVVKDQR